MTAEQRWSVDCLRAYKPHSTRVWDNKYKLENLKLMWFVNLSFLISNQKCVIDKPGMVFKVWLFTSFIFIRIANTTLSISISVFS